MIELRKIIVYLGIVLFVTGCVSSHMKQYIGKDISYVMIDSGKPVNVFDMPNGLKAYQFYWGGGDFVVPQTTTTQGSINSFGQFSSTTTTTPGGVYSSKGCLITYFTKEDKKTKRWIVVDISYPNNLVC